MDEYPNRRLGNRHPDSGRVSDLLSKRTRRSTSQASQLGCSNRSNVGKIVCSANPFASKHSDRYAERKRVVGGPSMSSSLVSSSTGYLWEPQQKLTPKFDKVLPPSASSGASNDGSIGHGLGVTRGIFMPHPVAGYPLTGELVQNAVSPQSARAGKNVTAQNRLTDLTVSRSSASKSKVPQTTIPSLSHSSSKHISKNLKCHSAVESRFHKRMELLKKGKLEGESSSSGVKRTGTLKVGETCGSAHGKSTAKLRKQIYWSGWDNDNASARRQGSAFPVGRVKPPNRKYGNNSALSEVQDQDINEQAVSVTISDSSVFGTNSSENSIIHPVTSENSTSSSDSSVATESANQGAFLHMDTITEALLALGHSAHAERLSIERLIFLEMNSFLSGLSIHDQHRDMRLDIDHMSYEDLLALEDRIGFVSTALTGEAMDRCINKSFFKPTPSEIASNGIGKDENDVKCSICQEEYEIADEVGRLHCEHMYHLCCIQQWLNQKNWCPICKSSVVPS